MGGNRKHTQVQPQPIQMFAVTIEPASAETRERMITSEIPAGVDRFNPDRVREIATFGYFAPTQIATHPETGEPLVVLSATFTVPLNLVCGYIPAASRLTGPQGRPGTFADLRSSQRSRPQSGRCRWDSRRFPGVRAE